MTYNDYFLRTTDYPTLLQLGSKLGVVALHYAEYEETEGEDGGVIRTPIGEPAVSANTYGPDGNPEHFGQFTYLGALYHPTAPVAEGEPQPEPVPITDAGGVPYIHANLRTTADLKALAQASTDPEVGAALVSLGAFFVTDAQGNAAAPANPYNRWA